MSAEWVCKIAVLRVTLFHTSFIRATPHYSAVLSGIQYRLYPSCHWEDKTIRRLIGDGKLAARLRGSEVRSADTDQECPICFLHYAEVNKTKCCHAVLCTECFLQVKPQREKTGVCPFCNCTRLQTTVSRGLQEHEIEERDRTEKRALEAQIQKRQDREARLKEQQEKAKEVGDQAVDDGTPTRVAAHEEFGSSLEQRQRVLSESMSTHNSAPGTEPNISVVAMSPDERRALEAEMQAQGSHPLSQRVQAEEDEKRFNNEMEYYRTAFANQRRQQEGGSSQRRNNRARLIEALEGGRAGGAMDDMMVMEAALMLSMQDGDGSSGDQRGRSRQQLPSGMVPRGMSEEEQLAMAIAASLETPESAPDDSVAARVSEGEPDSHHAGIHASSEGHLDSSSNTPKLDDTDES